MPQPETRTTDWLDLESRADELAGAEVPFFARAHMALVRATIERKAADRIVRTLQRRIGSIWMEALLKRTRDVSGVERLPVFDPKKTYLCIANHRSFFDLYAVTSFLVRRDLLPNRLLFPVRSTFFYEGSLGTFVNGAMSFFAMYPPIFREKALAHLNVAAVDEVIRLANLGGFFIGLHPEGTRNRNPDPLSFLPARPGVGRIVHRTNAEVLPVYVSGLSNDIGRQVRNNFGGDRVRLAFGSPLDVSAFRARPGSLDLFQEISEHCLGAVRALGEEALRGA